MGPPESANIANIHVYTPITPYPTLPRIIYITFKLYAIAFLSVTDWTELGNVRVRYTQATRAKPSSILFSCAYGTVYVTAAKLCKDASRFVPMGLFVERYVNFAPNNIIKFNFIHFGGEKKKFLVHGNIVFAEW